MLTPSPSQILFHCSIGRRHRGWCLCDVCRVKNENWLVVWTPLKNISQLGWLSPNMWENRKCSKPATRNIRYCPLHGIKCPCWHWGDCFCRGRVLSHFLKTVCPYCIHCSRTQKGNTFGIIGSHRPVPFCPTRRAVPHSYHIFGYFGAFSSDVAPSGIPGTEKKYVKQNA